MRRKRVLVVLGAVGLALLALGELLRPRPPEQPLTSLREQLRQGMSQAEADAVFGRPADETSTGPYGETEKTWRGHGGGYRWTLDLEFTEDRLDAFVGFKVAEKPSLLGELLSRLRGLRVSAARPPGPGVAPPPEPPDMLASEEEPPDLPASVEKPP
jgi:hypothetical protein